MMKKRLAIAAELIPVIAAVISFAVLYSHNGTGKNNWVLLITFPLAFLGFVFFFIGRKLAKQDKAVRVLGITDWLATLSIIGIYVAAIFSFGL